MMQQMKRLSKPRYKLRRHLQSGEKARKKRPFCNQLTLPKRRDFLYHNHMDKALCWTCGRDTEHPFRKDEKTVRQCKRCIRLNIKYHPLNLKKLFQEKGLL